MKRKGLTFLLITALIFTMMFASAAVSFAETSGESTDAEFQEELIENILLPDDILVEDSGAAEITPFSAENISVTANFTKSGGTGKATVKATGFNATKMTSTIQLQEYASRSGDFINSSAKPAAASKNGTTITHSATFTLSSTKIYRIKVTVTAYVNGKAVPVIVYRNLK